MSNTSIVFIRHVLDLVDFPGYTFMAHESFGRFYIRAMFKAPCSVTGKVEPQFTREWCVSDQATSSEIVQTALKCVLTAVEHEAREQFRYRGHAIFGPHFEVDELHALCSFEHLDMRV